jgi:hypothetical protein
VSAPEQPRPLPLLNPKVWALAFLVFAIVLTAVFALTMPGFFRDAYDLPAG